ncbi:MAG: hypothetical protein K6U87_04935, partial [Firmicutes bacterium]|nr:hypothetical protein [Bacillota bacterium]
HVKLEVRNLEQLSQIIRRLEGLPYVQRVERTTYERH